MQYLTFLLKVLSQESRKRNFLLKSLLLATLYLLIGFALINFQSITSIASSDYSLISKFRIISIIISGSFHIISERDAVLLLVSSVLFGLNMELVLRKLRFLRSRGSLHLTFGAGFITLVATGCASCGLSLASVVGLSAAIAILPFHGIELYFVGILLLLASLFYNLHTLVKACNINKS